MKKLTKYFIAVAILIATVVFAPYSHSAKMDITRVQTIGHTQEPIGTNPNANWFVEQVR